MSKHKVKSQSFIVYAAFIALLIAGLITISVYIRRAVQGRYHASADVFGEGAQYEPGVTHINE